MGMQSGGPQPISQPEIAISQRISQPEHMHMYTAPLASCVDGPAFAPPQGDAGPAPPQGDAGLGFGCWGAQLQVRGDSRCAYVV